MFNLEQSIADWREQMLAAGIKSPVPLEELESHLREDIEEQVKLGISEQLAFEITARQIGQAGTLDCEFRETGVAKEMTLKTVKKFSLSALIILAAIVITLNIYFAIAGQPSVMPAPNKPGAAGMLEMYNKFAGKGSETGVLQRIFLADLLLLSLALPFVAHYQAPTNAEESRRRKRIAWIGQLLIACGGLSIVFSGAPFLGLAFAIISCTVFVIIIRRQSRMALNTNLNTATG